MNRRDAMQQQHDAGLTLSAIATAHGVTRQRVHQIIGPVGPRPLRQRPSRPRRLTIRDRFWDYVDRSGGPNACWPWMRYRLPTGYGRVPTPGVRGATTNAHRMALELSGTVVPKGMYACHICDNPPCCNPKHLYVGTATDNAGDRERRTNRRGPHLTRAVITT